MATPYATKNRRRRKMTDDKFIAQLHEFLESKGLTQEETELYLKEVFKKAFEIDKDHLSKYEEEDPEPADITVNIDLGEAKVEVIKRLTVTDEFSQVKRFRQIEDTDERIEGLGLNVGDVFEEVIDFETISSIKAQRVKQLFLQKLSEIEKIKLYNKFSKFRNELITPKIHKLLNRGNVILDFNGDSIFMPAREVSPLDKDKLVIGKPLTIFVLDIEEMSKDAQIIASRTNPNFVSKLIEREIDDVHDGVVHIESIAREAGFKTKVAVSTQDPNVDPVGSIIGVKGQKIKPIVDEIGGERLDIIKYHPDIKQFIAEALLPAEITGIRLVQDEEGWRTASVVVEEDQFLPALGKRGINIKLAAILTRTKLDVKTIAEAKEEGIEWEPITKSKYVSQSSGTVIDLEEIQNITHELADQTHEDDTMFTDEDYEINEEFFFDNKQDSSDDEFYNPDEDDHEEF